MKCSLGTQTPRLIVTSQQFVAISGELIATEEDKVGMTNVPSFGACKCSSNNPPCIPSPEKWNLTTQQDTINGMGKLTEHSFCMCARGGKITFVNTGGNTFVESE